MCFQNSFQRSFDKAYRSLDFMRHLSEECNFRLEQLLILYLFHLFHLSYFHSLLLTQIKLYQKICETTCN